MRMNAVVKCTLSWLVWQVSTAQAKECAPGCAARGNCNADEGRCQCMFGWTGPNCERAILPGCQQGEWDRPLVGRSFPKNCACFKQAYRYFKCGHGRRDTCQFNTYLAIDTPCFSYVGVPEAHQRSVLPEIGRNDQPPATWHLFTGYDEELRSLPVASQFMYQDPWGNKYKALPLESCPGSCSGSGVCLLRRSEDEEEDGTTHEPPQPRCLCHKGYLSSGKDGAAPCDQEDMSLCPNECMGRGRCIVGFCHCKPPYWGADCGRETAIVYNPSAIPSRTKLAIYVYELPHFVSSSIAMDEGFGDRLSAHMAYEHFTAMLLKDNIHRTLDPYAANLFYVPAHSYSYSSNTGDPSPHLAAVLRFLKMKWPFYNRTGGRDHIVWTPGDRGACHARDGVQDVIKLTHFGYHVNRVLRPNASYMVPTPEDPHYGCFHPLRDVVAPPLFQGNEEKVKAMYDKVVASGGVDPERNLLFFFAGSVRAHQPYYSGGARQAVHRLLSKVNATGGDLSDVKFAIGRIVDYFDLYMRSKFCLCPHGAGFGMRLVIAMQYACIPVVTSDLVFQPLEDQLPYQEFSIRVPNSQLDRLLDILRSVTLEEQAALRRGMARWYRAFLWSPAQSGEAYAYTLRSLHRRRIHLWADMYR